MAARRMFSSNVISTDKFLDLDFSAQALYLQLNLVADDDGFVDATRMTVRTVGAKNSDLLKLVEAGLLIEFESGVTLISHWLIHNTIQKDRYTPTMYQQELSMVHLVNKTYALKQFQTGKEGQDQAENNPDKAQIHHGYDMETDRIHDVSNMDTDRNHSIDKVRLGKNNTYTHAREEESSPNQDPDSEPVPDPDGSGDEAASSERKLIPVPEGISQDPGKPRHFQFVNDFQKKLNEKTGYMVFPDERAFLKGKELFARGRESPEWEKTLYRAMDAYFDDRMEFWFVQKGKGRNTRSIGQFAANLDGILQEISGKTKPEAKPKLEAVW